MEHYDIFISYSRLDLYEVQTIKDDIEQSTRTKCWMDIEGISYDSHDWIKVVGNAIKECKVFLFMLSNNSEASTYAQNELLLAKKKRKPVFFIIFDNYKFTTDFYLRHGYANVCKFYNSEERQKLYKDIIRNLPLTPLEPKPSTYKIHNKKSHIIILVIISILLTTILFTVGYYHRYHRNKGMAEMFDSVSVWPDYYYKPMKEDNMWGFCSPEGDVLINPQWKSVALFSEGLAAVREYTDNGLCGYIDKTGDLIIPYEWNMAGYFSEGLAKVMNKDGLWGFINQNGSLVIKCTIPVEPTDFDRGMASYVLDDGRTYILEEDGGIHLKTK